MQHRDDLADQAVRALLGGRPGAEFQHDRGDSGQGEFAGEHESVGSRSDDDNLKNHDKTPNFVRRKAPIVVLVTSAAQGLGRAEGGRAGRRRPACVDPAVVRFSGRWVWVDPAVVPVGSGRWVSVRRSGLG
ncbi:hypothetical protein GCM10010437_071190 [Actinoplanes palleronii]